MEGLKECEANLVVYLHPSKANCASDAILGELSSLLFTYNETLEGVVLAYDPNITSNLAKIVPGIHPYLCVRLKARLLLFDPKPDMQLEGEVVKITPQSIHAVVLGFSSAFIAVEDIRDEFKHKCKHGEDVFVSRSDKKHKIRLGTILRFTVKRFDEEVLHVSGSLAGENTGCARWLDKNVNKWSEGENTVSTLKRRVADDIVEVKEAKNVLMNDPEILKDDEVKLEKSKKRRKEQG